MVLESAGEKRGQQSMKDHQRHVSALFKWQWWYDTYYRLTVATKRRTTYTGEWHPEYVSDCPIAHDKPIARSQNAGLALTTVLTISHTVYNLHNGLKGKLAIITKRYPFGLTSKLKHWLCESIWTTCRRWHITCPGSQLSPIFVSQSAQDTAPDKIVALHVCLETIQNGLTDPSGLFIWMYSTWTPIAASMIHCCHDGKRTIWNLNEVINPDSFFQTEV